MRHFRAVLTAAAITLTTGTMLAAPAQAAPDKVAASNCAYLWNLKAWDGYVTAYDSTDCSQRLGEAKGDDSNWNDAAGPFRSPANDKATSLLNTGSEAGGINNVQFFENAGYDGGTGCVAWGEHYVDDLRDNRFRGNGDAIANNRISSHRWSTGCTNPWT
ncbi:hypothetical protein [Streptomyces sp. DH37]|uniref:hypothetical protein n=1 Tax=Streptomyces sp. DH37 TaxID=3040122 RepID=UPI002442434C|nr:hypothetical protein [Streptomyces sp. DH37]MDG9703862.1 hypothetical protein [Streptomyces sp. DH37]